MNEDKLRYLVGAKQLDRAEMLANYLNAKGVKELYRHILIHGQTVIKMSETPTEWEIWVSTGDIKIPLHRICLVNR